MKKYWAEENTEKAKVYAAQKASDNAAKEKMVKLPTNQDPTVVNPWALPSERSHGTLQAANLSPRSLTTQTLKASKEELPDKNKGTTVVVAKYE